MAISIDVSFVVRLRVAVRVTPATSRERGEEPVVLLRRADRDPQAPAEARPARAVAHEHAAVDEALPHAVALVDVAVADPEQHEVGAARERLDGQRGEAVHEPLALLDDDLHALVHLVDVAQGERAGDLLGRVEVVRQHDVVEVADEPRRADEVAEAGRRHAPRLRERAHDDERAVLGDEVEGAPAGELGVGLVDDDEPVGRVERGVDDRRVLDDARSGCSASTGTSPSAGARGRPRRRRPAIEREVGDRARPRRRSRPVMRAMWPCSWYVGSNVSTERPAPAYVSSSVCSTSLRAVGGEHLAGLDAVPRGDRRRAGRRPTGRGSGATRSPPSAPASSSRQPGGGGNGDSLVLRRTSTSTWAEWYPSSARRSSRIGHEVGARHVGDVTGEVRSLAHELQRLRRQRPRAELSAAAEAVDVVPAARRRPRRTAPRHRARGPRRRDLRGRTGAAHRRAPAPAGRQARPQLTARRSAPVRRPSPPIAARHRRRHDRHGPKSGDGPWWEGPSHGRRQAADPGCRSKPGGGNLVGDTEHITAPGSGKQAPTVSGRASFAPPSASSRRAGDGAGRPWAAGWTGRCPRANSVRTPAAGRSRPAGRGGSCAG